MLLTRGSNKPRWLLSGALLPLLELASFSTPSLIAGTHTEKDCLKVANAVGSQPGDFDPMSVTKPGQAYRVGVIFRLTSGALVLGVAHDLVGHRYVKEYLFERYDGQIVAGPFWAGEIELVAQSDGVVFQRANDISGYFKDLEKYRGDRGSQQNRLAILEEFVKAMPHFKPSNFAGWRSFAVEPKHLAEQPPIGKTNYLSKHDLVNKIAGPRGMAELALGDKKDSIRWFENFRRPIMQDKINDILNFLDSVAESDFPSRLTSHLTTDSRKALVDVLDLAKTPGSPNEGAIKNVLTRLVAQLDEIAVFLKNPITDPRLEDYLIKTFETFESPRPTIEPPPRRLPF